jgi:hypothetical protein
MDVIIGIVSRQKGRNGRTESREVMIYIHLARKPDTTEKVRSWRKLCKENHTSCKDRAPGKRERRRRLLSRMQSSGRSRLRYRDDCTIREVNYK